MIDKVMDSTSTTTPEWIKFFIAFIFLVAPVLPVSLRSWDILCARQPQSAISGDIVWGEFPAGPFPQV